MSEPNNTPQSLRQMVHVVGTLETVQPGTARFTLRLDNEQEVPCVLVEGDRTVLESLAGKRIAIEGMGVWRLNGRLERVEVDRFHLDEDETSLWSRLPTPRFPWELPPEEPTPRPFGLEAFLGQWPGDETDEQIEEALKRLS